MSDCITHSNPSFSKGAKDAAEHRFPDGTVDWYMSSDFNIDYDSVELLDLVAKGSYGTVYKALWRGNIVAAKLEDFKDGDEEQVNLLVELTMLQCFPHERCVRFLGAGCISHDFGTHVEKKVMVLIKRQHNCFRFKRFICTLKNYYSSLYLADDRDGVM